MVFADFDYEEFPVVVVNFYEKPADEEEFKQYMDELNCLLNCCSQKSSRCCLIFNCIEMEEKIPLSYAKRQAVFLKNNKSLLEQGLSASSIIGPKWVKAVLKLIFAISPPVKPCIVTRKMDKGLNHVNKYKENCACVIDKEMILDSLASTESI